MMIRVKSAVSQPSNPLTSSQPPNPLCSYGYPDYPVLEGKQARSIKALSVKIFFSYSPGEAYWSSSHFLKFISSTFHAETGDLSLI